MIFQEHNAEISQMECVISWTRFFCEDLAQAVLQFIFLVKVEHDTRSRTTIRISVTLSLLISFYKLLSSLKKCSCSLSRWGAESSVSVKHLRKLEIKSHKISTSV